MIPQTTTTRPAGSAVKPSVCASGENGSAKPIATTTSVEARSGVLGRLRKNGTRRVRIETIARVWVASDSTNQPERNSVASAWKPRSRVAKGLTAG